MSASDWTTHVKQVREAYLEAGIRISYNQAMFLARESFKEVKAGNPNPHIIIEEDKIPEHVSGRKKDCEKPIPKEIKFVEPRKVPLRRVATPAASQYEDDYYEEPPRRGRGIPRRPPPRYEEDYYEYEEPPRRGRGRGRGLPMRRSAYEYEEDY